MASVGVAREVPVVDSCGASNPQVHIAIARRVLTKGDAAHALYHVAQALAEDPNRADWLKLLDEIVAADAEPLQLVPEAETASALRAVRAYILADRGRLPEAVDLLLEVIAARPDVLYLDWVLSWLQRPEAAERIDTARLAEFLGTLTSQFAALSAPYGGGRGTLDRLPFFIQLVRRTQPPDSGFLAAGVAILRRLGHLEEALKLAREAYELEPGAQTAVSVAVAHASRNEIEPALKAFRDAIDFDPDDIPIRLSMADLLVNHGRQAEAEELYAKALEQEPGHPIALPSYYFLRLLADGKDEWRDKLLRVAEDQPDSERAQRLAQQVAPYVGFLPGPEDAAVEQALATTGPIALTYLIAPSNYLVHDRLRGLKASVARIQQPDPRWPRGPVDYLLWKYDGDRPHVALPPPEGNLAWAVAEVARQHYHLDAWLQYARRLAGQLNPNQVEDLLATMVYPPRPPAMQGGAWIFRVQVAAALVIARLDGDWRDSKRRKALLSLARGPMDWTVNAAVVALAALAREDDDAAEEIAAVFRDLRQGLPDGGPMCYYPALLWCSLRLPNLEAEEREEIRERLRQLRTD